MRVKRTWSALWAMAIGVAILSACATSEVSAQGERPRSYLEIRYERVVGQTDWSTCGPAVLATYLTHYAGRDTSEAEMVQMTLGAKPLEEVEIYGTSMLQLRDALVQVGVEALGYRIGVEELTEYFDRGGPPLILHVTRPRAHFVLAVGNVATGDLQMLFLADPSYGRRLVLPDELETQLGFSGHILLPLPHDSTLRQVRQRQRDELAWEAQRLGRLEEVGRWSG